jgi:hypothetical protein
MEVDTVSTPERGSRWCLAGNPGCWGIQKSTPSRCVLQRTGLLHLACSFIASHKKGMEVRIKKERKGWFRKETNSKPEFRVSSHYVKFYRSSDFSLPLSSLIHGGSQTCTISKWVAQEYRRAISLAFYFVPSFLTQRTSQSSLFLKMHLHSFTLLIPSAIWETKSPYIFMSIPLMSSLLMQAVS